MAGEVGIQVLNGFATVTISAGFTIKNVTTGKKQPRRVHFVNPPVKSSLKLLDWVCGVASCSAADIVFHALRTSSSSEGQNGSSTLGVVVFPTAAQAAEAHLSYARLRNPAEHGSYHVLVKLLEGNLKDLMRAENVFPSKSVNIRPTRCLVNFTNVPEATNDQRFRALLRKHKLPDPSYVRSSRPVNGTRNVFLVFNGNVKLLEKIVSGCKGIPELRARFQITVPSKLKNVATRQITVATKCSETLEPALYLVTFPTCQEADSLYLLGQASSDFDVDGQATVMVRHPEAFPLEDHLRDIESTYSVACIVECTLPDGTRKVRINDHFTSVCEEAAEALRNAVAPVKFVFEGRDHFLMGRKMSAHGRLQRWAEEFDLAVDEYDVRGCFLGIGVYGAKHQQCKFMARLADHVCNVEFTKRHHLVPLTTATNCLFRKGHPGDAELERMAQAMKSDRVRLIHHGLLSSVEIAVHRKAERPPSDIIEDCVRAIQGILTEFSQKSPGACVYCGIHVDTTFSACGHPYCAGCLQSVAELALSAAEADRADISAEDLRQSLPKFTMQTACVTLAKLHLASADPRGMGICPVPLCDAFVPKRAGYTSCPLCRQPVCSACAVFRDNNHRGVDCEEYQRRAKVGRGADFLEGIVEAAKKYVRAHWRSCLRSKRVWGDIATVDVNPGLRNGCTALQRYCAGIQRVGLADFERNATFAWYCAGNAAIPAICDDGFGPKTRRTQAFGPGDYFPVDAETCLSYAEECKRPVVVQLIRCPDVKKIENFCYIVDNPTDRSYAFALPVLVVSFENVFVESEISWILGEKRLLPYPFDEPPSSEEALAQVCGSLQNATLAELL